MAAGIDDIMLLSGLMSAGTSAGNNIFSTIMNQVNSERQRNWSEKMYANQNAWNEEMWNKQNEYNSPVNQVKRLEEAGLNPLFYGLDGNSTNNLIAAQPLGYERAQAPNLGNPAAAFQDALVKQAQLENVQADTAKKNNENLTETQRRQNMAAELDNIKQELQVKLADESLKVSQRAAIDKATEWVDRLNEANINYQQSMTALNNLQKKRIDELLEGEKIMQSKTIEDFDHKWKKMQVEMKKMSYETGLNYLDIVNYAVNHMNGGIMGSGVSLTNFVRSAGDTADAVNPNRKNTANSGLDVVDAVYNTPVPNK